jgi:hypothetical protein
MSLEPKKDLRVGGLILAELGRAMISIKEYVTQRFSPYIRFIQRQAEKERG